MIPDRLQEDSYLIKLEKESKAPVDGPKNGPFYRASDPELQNWIEEGGNVGKAFNGPFICFDVDSPKFGELLDDRLPPTYIIQTGSGAEHRYYHCPEWTENHQFTNDGTDLGSLRTDNWQAAIPPTIHPDTGDRYRVLEDRHITSISESEIESAISQIPGEKASTQGGGGGTPPGGGCVGASSTGSDTQVPEKYPNRNVRIYRVRKWVEANDLGYKFDRISGKPDTETDRSAIDFVLVKCMTEGGFSVDSIIETMNEHRSEQSKWHRRGDDYRRTTVLNAISETMDDVSEGYVNFSDTGDMGGNTSESRKTEKNLGGSSAQMNGGELLDMVDDNVTNHVTVKSDSGNRVVRSGVVEVDNDDNSWEYVGVLFGDIDEEEDLGTVVSWEYNQYSQKNYNDLGDRDPDELRLAAEALEQLADELE